MSEWQTIETAPKDGTSILLFWPNGLFDGEANDYDGEWSDGFVVMKWNQRSWEGYYSVDNFAGKPTHWMPLPSPPEGAK